MNNKGKIDQIHDLLPKHLNSKSNTNWKALVDALGEQYLPKFAGDVLPKTKTGTTIALADRLDTLTGIFGIGQAPTGSKDPFALRRSAIGILRLVTEKELDVSIEELITSLRRKK